MEFSCPFCGCGFKFYDKTIKTITDMEGCSCDCPECGKVLLSKDGAFIDAIAYWFDGYDINHSSIGYIDI